MISIERPSHPSDKGIAIIAPVIITTVLDFTHEMWCTNRSRIKNLSSIFATVC